MEHPCNLDCRAVDDYLLTIAEVNLGPNCHRMKATCVPSGGHPGPGRDSLSIAACADVVGDRTPVAREARRPGR
jgi:hypothetical protein